MTFKLKSCPSESELSNATIGRPDGYTLQSIRLGAPTPTSQLPLSSTGLRASENGLARDTSSDEADRPERGCWQSRGSKWRRESLNSNPSTSEHVQNPRFDQISSFEFSLYVAVLNGSEGCGDTLPQHPHQPNTLRKPGVRLILLGSQVVKHG